MRITRDQAAVISMLYDGEVEVQETNLEMKIGMWQEQNTPPIQVQAEGSVISYIVLANGNFVRFSGTGFEEMRTMESLVRKGAE